jgi:hypothetical protein
MRLSGEELAREIELTASLVEAQDQLTRRAGDR